MSITRDTQLDAWIDQHFDEQVKLLQELVRVPTDSPPGNNAPHAERTAELFHAFGFEAEKHPVPEAEVKAYGLETITNLIVRRPYASGGKTIALNAHGDVVPPGEGWTHDPYGGEIENGAMYGRATAVSKSDFSTFTFAARALEAVNAAADLLVHGEADAHRRARLARLAGAAPLAMLFNEMTTKIALGAVVTHAPAMTAFDRDPLEVIATGDWVKVDADRGFVEVTKPPGRNSK